jgi:lipoprotein-releasing system permease protein
MIGVFSGAILGVAVCLVLKEYHFIKLPASIYTMEYLPVALDAPDIILIIVLGILLAFFSSLAPALRASRMTPCDALRYE